MDSASCFAACNGTIGDTLLPRLPALMTMSCWMSVKIKKLHIVGILPMIFEKNQLQYKISYWSF